MPPKTLYQKIWDDHVVWEEPGKPALIYIDRHLIHEGTSPQAFAGLRAEGRKVRRPNLTFAVIDRKSTRLNSSHVSISYAVFCLKKKKKKSNKQYKTKH